MPTDTRASAGPVIAAVVAVAAPATINAPKAIFANFLITVLLCSLRAPCSPFEGEYAKARLNHT